MTPLLTAGSAIRLDFLFVAGSRKSQLDALHGTGRTIDFEPALIFLTKLMPCSSTDADPLSGFGGGPDGMLDLYNVMIFYGTPKKHVRSAAAAAAH